MWIYSSKSFHTLVIFSVCYKIIGKVKGLSRKYLCTRSSPPGTLSRLSSNHLCGCDDHRRGTGTHERIGQAGTHEGQAVIRILLLKNGLLLTFLSPFTPAGAGAASSADVAGVCPIRSELMVQELYGSRTVLGDFGKHMQLTDSLSDIYQGAVSPPWTLFTTPPPFKEKEGLFQNKT